MTTYSSLKEARKMIPEDAKSGCTFGYCGEGGYTEYWMLSDNSVITISNGDYLQMEPFSWKLKRRPDFY